MGKASQRYGITVAIVLLLHACMNAQYRMKVLPVDTSAFTYGNAGLQTAFKNRAACAAYIGSLTALLQAKGYLAASVDSVYYDSTAATVWLFTGENYPVAVLNTNAIDKKILEQSGWKPDWQNKPLDMASLQALKLHILEYFENTGYPFAKVYLDSIVFNAGKIGARLAVSKGRLYTIDSIRLRGSVKISNSFLQHYLEIPNGTVYHKSRLQQISKKLLELPYLQEQQPWSLTMLGTGAIVDLYLQPKKSSQVNVLLGFLPSSGETGSSKLLLTGEANINLRNALGNGEMIGVNWQQLQVKSPRLNLAFQQPYLFGSSFGISATFDLFKKDTSYLNLNFLLGVQYALPGEQTGQVFIQSLQTNLLNVDTVMVKSGKKLPDNIDVRSVSAGISYEVNKTNYRFNPKRGSELQFTLSAGTRMIKKNNVIVKLHDPGFSFASLYDSVKQNTYQFRIKFSAAHYFSTGRQATVKAALNGGWFQSPGIFRNELFQIGGYRLLRGFDEESIFASQYLVGTVEYRYLIGLNSFLFSFIDAGRAANNSNGAHQANAYIGGGVGMAFETKAGIFNISYAVGTRDDARLNLRQSKIHLGYVNFF